MYSGSGGGDMGGAVVHSNSTDSYVPHHMTFTWKDAECCEHVGISISVPTGLLTREDDTLDNKVEATVSECGTILEYVCSWPVALTDTTLLMAAVKGYQSQRSSANIAVGFDDTVNALRMKFNANTLRA